MTMLAAGGVFLMMGCHVTPTADDQRLVSRYNQLQSELDHGISREIFNHLRSTPHVAAWRDAMGQRQPMTSADRDEARRYFQQQIDIAERSRHWPAPVGGEIRQATGPITIDGRLTESDWQASAELPIRYRVNEPGPDQAVAQARLLWDGQCLYAAWIVRDADIQSPALQRDGPVYDHDCVELFLMPDRQAGLYWELNVSPSQSVYDALCLWNPDGWAGLMRKDQDIPGLRIGISRTEGGYIVEIALPWESLSVPAGWRVQSGMTIDVLLAVGSRDGQPPHGKRVYHSHSPVLANFHHIQMYAPFRLVDR